MLKLKGLELASLHEHQIDNVTKLDVSNNLLTNLEGIEVWQDELKWLNASHNQIKSIKHIRTCNKLNVLNLGYNKISSTKHMNKLKELNALILNNNDLVCLDGLSALKELNTLVVSSNNLENIDLTSLKQLQKFSASHNKLKEFPSLQSQKAIKDLKLNDNKIEQIPDWVVSSCIRIKVLDLGNNNLKDLKSIMCLCELPYLENLNLKGNLLCNVDDYHIKMKEMFPSLKILDFKKLSDLYFKAIDDQSKKLPNSHNLKENSNKLETSVSVDLTSKRKDLIDESGACNKSIPNHGFKSSKRKSKDSITTSMAMESTVEVNKKDVTSIAHEGSINSTKLQKENPVDTSVSAKSEEQEKHLKYEKIDPLGKHENSNQNNSTAVKKKKAKKRKLSNSTPGDDIDKFNTKKNKKEICVKKHEHETNDTIITRKQDLTKTLKDNCESKNKEKEKKKKNCTKSKAERKKSGVVAIKAISVKKQNPFNSDALYDDSASFGMGQSYAWN